MIYDNEGFKSNEDRDELEKQLTEIFESIHTLFRRKNMRAKKILTFQGGGGLPGSGLFTELLQQPNNRSENIKVKVFYPEAPNSGLWNDVTPYTKSNTVNWPNAASPLVFRANKNVTGGSNPLINTTDWDLVSGLDFIQDSGDGINFFRYKIGWQLDEFNRIKGLEYGTYAETNYELSTSNCLTDGFLGTSTTSHSIPTALGQSRTLTIPAGLNIQIGASITIKQAHNRYYIMTVTAYDNGTGVMSGTCDFFTSSGTFAAWNIYSYRVAGFIGATVPTGTNDLSGIANGEFLKGTFTTGALFFRHATGAGGKGWLFHYTGGPNIANPPADVIIDTYDPSGVAKLSLVWRDLLSGNHTFTQTIVTSPSGASTNTTAYFRASSDTVTSVTYSSRYHYDVFTASLVLSTGSDSFGELAYSFRLDANPSDTPQWFPDHDAVLTGVGLTKIYKVNGAEINIDTTSPEVNPYMYKYTTCLNCSLQQTGQVVHPQSGAAADYESTHSLDKYGILYDVELTWLQAVLIGTGYNNMVSMREQWFDRMKTGGGDYIDRDPDQSVNLTAEQIDLDNYIFYSTNVGAPDKDIAIAQFWVNKAEAWRTGLASRGTSYLQDFSGTTRTKFYPFVYQSYVTTPAETSRVNTRIYLGNYIDANSHL